MYEVVVSVVGLALLVAVLLFDCRVRVAAARPGTWHFSDWLVQSACATARRCVSLLSILSVRRSGSSRRSTTMW